MYKSTRYDKFNKCRLCTLSVVINGQRLMIMYKKKINVKKHISANEKYFIDLCADCMRWEGEGDTKTQHTWSAKRMSLRSLVYIRRLCNNSSKPQPPIGIVKSRTGSLVENCLFIGFHGIYVHVL